MYYIYLLKSKLNGELYRGSTNNLRSRFKDHNDGKVFSTKRYGPWEVIYYEVFTEEKLARAREQKLKHNGNAMRELKKRLNL